MSLVNRAVGLVFPGLSLREANRLLKQGQEFDAFRLFARAAQAGIRDAEYRVAQCYLTGSGVPRSRTEGIRWLKRSASQGCSEAQVLLSVLYLEGHAGEDDSDQALFTNDTVLEPDFTSAERWSRMAAMAGCANGQA